MERWEDKVAVVTGASSGIGHAIAITLANHGMKVVAVARRLQRLKDLAAGVTGKGTILPFAADVTNEDEVIEMIKTAEREFGACHVLVNNAGAAYHTKVLEGDMEKWRGMFDLNVLSLGAATREAVASMLKNDINDGHIINISSISAHHPPTDLGKHVYNATKHAVRVITEGIRAELTNLKSNIKVSMVSPGVVATEIFDVGGWGTYNFDLIPALESQDVANGVVAVLSTPPNVLVAEYIVRPMKETVFA
ncbi:dehydrogenase/reductase SDR family member 11-like [Cimex lectularius]|uniref:Dehydrogenase n=1 Tax=Cimex lectularius TaxID=79782 RepID=A0A8I6TG74_CIMLE|nr:dehydrogenase/reductase SDR family member 11-like [Cimex lectularius]